MRWIRPLLLAALALASAARADSEIVVTLKAGDTVKVNVGFARGGVACDDTSIVSADMVTEDGVNKVTLKGLKAGKTLCRAGAVGVGVPSRLLNVTVEPPDSSR